MTKTINLAGAWECHLQGDAFPESFRIQLPGTTDSNEIGVPGTMDSHDYFSRRKSWIGEARYIREVEIPAAWIGRRIELFLERVLWKSTVYINGEAAGSRDSLCTPHHYRLDPWLTKAGTYQLEIRVDNREHYRIGVPFDQNSISHAYSEHTQSIWNGIIGNIALECRPSVGIDAWTIEPKAEPQARVHTLTVYNDKRRPGEARITLEHEGANPIGQTVHLSGAPFDRFVLTDETPSPLWDEFNPHCITYRLVVAHAGTEDRQIRNSGQRCWAAEGTKLLINGNETFLRGTLDCAIWPLTGHPPMERDSWSEVLSTIKSSGCNHVRYHSWCPPEAAFQAADELGLYLQVEAGSWTTLGIFEDTDRFLDSETQQILKSYGHHPSFCFLAIGNEPSSELQHDALQRWLENTKRCDGRLYCGASGWPMCSNSDFHILMGVIDELPPTPTDEKGEDGLTEWQRNAIRTQPWDIGFLGKLNQPRIGSRFDYQHALENVKQPVVAHEVGQWCTFPEMENLDAYDGPLSPENYRHILKTCEQAGLLSRLPDYLRGSVALSKLCYRAEIEAALATENLSGIQLLGLQDFPGQGTAPIGLMDALWQPKPGCDPAEIESWWRPCMVLPRFDHYVWSPRETCVIDLLAVCFTANPPAELRIDWTIQEKAGAAILRGIIEAGPLATGRTALHESITSPCRDWPRNRPLDLVLSLTLDGGTPQISSWPLWCCEGDAQPESVQICTEWTSETRDAIAAGAKVIYFLEASELPVVQTAFPPIFWNTRWTNGQAPHTLGLVIKKEHPALAGFPCEGYQDWLWQDILCSGKAFPLPPEAAPAPVEVIPDWNDPRPLAFVQTGRFGKGLLSIIGCQLPSANERPATSCLIQSIADWMHQTVADTEPEIKLSPELHQHLLEK